MELSNGLVFRGLIKTRERNSLMKDSRECAMLHDFRIMVTNQIIRRENLSSGAQAFHYDLEKISLI